MKRNIALFVLGSTLTLSLIGIGALQQPSYAQNGNGGGLPALRERVTTFEGQVTDLQNTIATLEDRITALENAGGGGAENLYMETRRVETHVLLVPGDQVNGRVDCEPDETNIGGGFTIDGNNPAGTTTDTHANPTIMGMTETNTDGNNGQIISIRNDGTGDIAITLYAICGQIVAPS